ncbi:hemicentin-1-like [Branchiostoma floridae]|uniref:Hemicentin-1-like n=1 Tax=Branchiostoma floridae TaxID=7739 RepID=A0A9J7HGK5_BRAFL|nr:hemicentin-1-like [Branchiostoma floridae]
MYQLYGFNNREIFGPGYETRTTFMGGISNQDVSLQLTGLTENDSGTYNCYVSVFGDGDDQKTTDISVLDPPGTPTLSLSPTQVCETQNQDVQLTCTVTSGTTPFTYTFHREDTQLASDGSASLTLRNVDRVHAGTYTCTVSNVLGPDYSQTSSEQSVVVHYLDTPHLTPSSPVTVVEGDDLSVVCSVTSDPASPTLQWGRGGNDEPTGATLRKTPVSRSDAGTYTCTATNTCGTGSRSSSAQVVVEVQYPPDETPTCTVTESGNNIVLRCELQGGNPAVDLVWTYGSGQQAGTSQMSVNQVNAPVTADGTTYTCTATSVALNPGGTCSVTLTAPSVTVSPQPTSTVLLGTASHSLTCTVDSPGVPAASALTWTGPAVTAGRTTGGTLTTPSLTISGVLKTDAGDYTCTATNLVGDGSDSLSLVVHYPPELTVTATPNPVNETQSVSLTCTADSNPGVTSMTWVFVETGETLIQQTTGNSLTYTSSSVSHENAGVYRCTVDNGVVGSPVDKDQALNVNFVPIFNHTREVYVIQTSQPVTLECSAFAYPPQIVYTWMKGGYDITGNATSQDGVSTLYIASVERENYGDYTCKARNGHGQRSTVIQLAEESQPEAPNNLDYTKKTAAGVVTLTWTAGFNGGLETTHTVQYRLEATTDWVSGPSVVEAVSQNRPEFTQTLELSEKGQYEIRIRAQNSQGAVGSNVIQVLVEENQILYGTLAIASVDYTEGICDGELSNRVVTQLDSIFDSYKGYEGAEVTGCRSGSVLADFQAIVAQSESAAAQTSYTQELADGQLGEFTVDLLSSRISDTQSTGEICYFLS